MHLSPSLNFSSGQKHVNLIIPKEESSGLERDGSKYSMLPPDSLQAFAFESSSSGRQKPFINTKFLLHFLTTQLPFSSKLADATLSGALALLGEHLSLAVAEKQNIENTAKQNAIEKIWYLSTPITPPGVFSLSRFPLDFIKT
ncbi:MAG: hypothetical protein K6B71_02820 [Alphaproteobacteria bacterium]|nr:hypothetical protein [Alphaproteobacteria bacterium]